VLAHSPLATAPRRCGGTLRCTNAPRIHPRARRRARGHHASTVTTCAKARPRDSSNKPAARTVEAMRHTLAHALAQRRPAPLKKNANERGFCVRIVRSWPARTPFTCSYAIAARAHARGMQSLMNEHVVASDKDTGALRKCASSTSRAPVCTLRARCAPMCLLQRSTRRVHVLTPAQRAGNKQRHRAGAQVCSPSSLRGRVATAATVRDLDA